MTACNRDLRDSWPKNLWITKEDILKNAGDQIVSGPIDFYSLFCPYYRSQWDSNLKHPSVFHIQVWTNMRVSKWRPNFDFWVNCSFKVSCFVYSHWKKKLIPVPIEHESWVTKELQGGKVDVIQGDGRKKQIVPFKEHLTRIQSKTLTHKLTDVNHKQTNSHTPTGHRLVVFSFRRKLAAVNTTFIRQPDDRIWERSKPAPSNEVILILISSPGAEKASRVSVITLKKKYLDWMQIMGGFEGVWPP